MNFFFDWSNIVNEERREIVFENRNKEYGGYILRKKYQSYVLTALIISVLIIGLSISAPMILSVLSKINLENKLKITESIKLEEPPPIDKNTPPPPPVEPPPPLRQTIKFTPPKVVKMEEMEEPPPTQEQAKETQVSTITQEGSNDIVELPPDPIVTNEEETVFIAVEEMPSFPGGDQKLAELLARIKYPIIARENNISGYVYLSFVVDKEGKIKDAKVIRGIGGGCDEEALRVLMSLPDWRPGRQNGRAVSVKSSVRVNFTLN